jgi:Leucine-rich repeat (LRR) protein
VQGHLEAITLALPNLRFLCLADNLLGSWQHVMAIADALPQLGTLDVSGNRLSTPSAPGQGCQAGKRLHTLVANRCHTTWRDVVSLAAQLPSLQELYLSGNAITSLDPACEASEGTGQQATGTAERLVSAGKSAAPLTAARAVLTQLTLLDLTDNELAGWESIKPLLQLRSLAELKLSGNRLGTIQLAGTALPYELHRLSVRVLSMTALHSVLVASSLHNPLLRSHLHGSAFSFLLPRLGSN